VFDALERFYFFKCGFDTQWRVKKILRSGEPVFLEIGAGDKTGSNGWLTLDMNFKCDLVWDLRKGIPFPDNSISKIYSSHLFEHLTYAEIGQLLQECKRALVPGGIFSICVPNAKFFVDAYYNCGTQNQFWDSLPSFYKPAFNNTTRIDILNYIAYMIGDHKYMFDEENIVFILKQNKFSNVHIRSFDPEIDLKEREVGSLYAEANK
jgi:predicted SAM-dependent methyltransferase